MASLGHITVGMAAARMHHTERPTRWALASAMVVWAAISLLPDADVVGFRFGIAYGDAWGHRGASHSLVLAVVLGLGFGFLAAAANLSGWRTGLLACLVLASHGILDAFTDGGLGCALLWPFSDERFFAPWRPLPVAPIGARFFGPAGLRVAWVELAWFAPLLVYALWPRRDRQKPAP